jgi:hypothetical protein
MLLPPKKRREAERRKAQCTGAASADAARALRSARSPLGAPPRLSSGSILTRLQARFPGTRLAAALLASRLSQSSGSTPRTGRNTGGHDARSRPGAVCETARRHRTRPASSDRIRNASLRWASCLLRYRICQRCQERMKLRLVPFISDGKHVAFARGFVDFARPAGNRHRKYAGHSQRFVGSILQCFELTASPASPLSRA